MKNTISPQVLSVINTYPESMRKKLLFLRQLVFEVACDVVDNKVEETLKWGEPAYVCKTGSTIRIDRLKSNTDQYAIYFHCKTTLIDTFKELYGDKFTFIANRAIVFTLADTVPVDELKHCISLSFTYHKIKHLPLLGA